jgi:membrane protein required for colicin V production
VTSLKVIDYVFLVLTLLLVIRCTLRGFISEFMTLASLVLGALASLFLYRSGAAFLRDRWLEGLDAKIPAFLQNLLPGLVRNIPEILAFVLIFVVVFFAVKLVEFLLKDIIQRIRLGGVDRFLGLLFGMAEGVAVTSLLLLILNVQPVFDAAPLLEGSVFAELLLPLVGRAGALKQVPPDGLSAALMAGLRCSKIS